MAVYIDLKMDKYYFAKTKIKIKSLTLNFI